MSVIDAIRITPTWHDLAVFLQGAVFGALLAYWDARRLLRRTFPKVR